MKITTYHEYYEFPRFVNFRAIKGIDIQNLSNIKLIDAWSKIYMYLKKWLYTDKSVYNKI